MVDRSYSTFFKSVSVTSTSADASADVIFTVPTNYDAEFDLMIATNGGSTQNISLQVYHSEDSAYHHIARSHSVAGNDSYHFINGGTLFLHAGDKVVAYKAGGTFDVSVSGKLFFNPQRNI